MSASSFNIPGDASERYERYVAPVMRSFVTALVEQAALRPGDSVLDVACGTGFVARRAAEVVGPTGRVVGVDTNPAMLETARRALATSPHRFEWIEASALEIPLPDAEFDAVLCQQGIQFMPDRAAALAEMVRLTRPAGKVAVTFFTPLAGQPYFSAQLAEFDRLLGSPFLAQAFEVDPSEVRDAMASLGLHETTVDTVEGELLVARPLDEFVWGHALSLPAAPALQGLGDAGRERFVRAMVRVLEEFSDPAGGARIPVRTYLASGRR